MTKKKEPEYELTYTRGVIRYILPFAIVILLLIVGFKSFVTIPAGHRGVVMYLGAVEDRVLSEGFHFITPFMEGVVLMEVRTKKYEVSATAATKDLLDVTTTVAVNYHLLEGTVNDLYQTLGESYEERLIAPAVQEVVKAATANYNADELITQRPMVKIAIEQGLRERLGERDIVMETISLTDFTFPQLFNQAIIEKQTAIQLKLKAENDLERIKVEAQQAIATAEGEARSIQIVNEELLKSKAYIQFLAMQKWNGVLPLATGSGVIPFIEISTGGGNYSSP